MEISPFIAPGLFGHPSDPDPRPPEKVANEYLEKGMAIRAIDLVMRDRSCTSHQAVFFICRDWMEARRIPLVGENPLDTTVKEVSAVWEEVEDSIDELEVEDEQVDGKTLEKVWQWLIT